MNFVIQNNQGEQLGFLLMVADDNAPQTGACLIKLMTQTEALSLTTQAKLLEKLQSFGELIWQFDGQKTLLSCFDDPFLGYIKEQSLIIQDTHFILVDLTGNI